MTSSNIDMQPERINSTTTMEHPRVHIRSDLQKKLEGFLNKDGSLDLFWLNIKSFSLFEKLYGHEAGNHVLYSLEEILKTAVAEILPGKEILIIERVEQASLILILKNGRHEIDMLLDISMRLKGAVRHRLNEEVVSLTGQTLILEVGCTQVPIFPREKIWSRLYEAIGDARQMAEGLLDADQLPLMAEFRRLIQEPKLYSVYQPLVDLSSGQVFGWESLARGPEGEYFQSPKAMFDFAEEIGALFFLERACRERALAGLGGLLPGQKLFINIHPKTLGDPQFRPGETRRLLAEYGLEPSNVVFEITERHSIRNFTLFHQALDHYRSQGFMVAIDDVGTGFSGLNRLARLRPDYIKADMGLIQGIDTNPVQRALMETLVTFADKIGCSIVAEGIETATEMSCLISMGVHYGQGFYLARPGRPKPQVNISLPPRVVGSGLPETTNWKCSIPIKQLVEPVPQVSPKDLVRKVKVLLDNHPISGAVVTEDQVPVGLIMSHSLDRRLGAQYGTALYYDRQVELVMDTSPLVVDGSFPVERVAKKAMSRERFKLYDHVIVTQGGKSLGVVSVQKLLDALARVQVEMAKGANPLTGLPGGVTLEKEIEKRIAEEEQLSLIYVDIDNFKAYNDTYGFKAGDKVITMTAELLTWACRRHGGRDAFLGHIGGDDFVVITTPEQSERLCLGVVRCFKRLTRGVYLVEDLKKGYVEAKGRDGKKGRFDLVSISLGIVDCLGPGSELRSIAQRAAEIKQYAKSIPGNVYVRDRRRPLGQ